jgi:TrmH family RNA methyltransferase
MNQIEIISTDNNKIKLLRKLNQKKYRNETGSFFIENAVIINDALKSGIQFESLYVSNKFVEKNNDTLKKILHNSGTKRYYLIKDSIYETFSNLDTPPGICAVYKKIQEPIDYNSHIIYLNGINDPGNLGTILRNALALGLKNIVVDEDCADIYNYKTLQAAKDSIFKLNIFIDKDRQELNKIKCKMKIYSTQMQNATTLDTIKKQNKFCLVFGSESHGVSKEIKALSDSFIKIGISNEIESLNVASAAAIFFYEISKKDLTN